MRCFSGEDTVESPGCRLGREKRYSSISPWYDVASLGRYVRSAGLN